MVDCECQEKSIEKTHSIRKDKRTNLKDLPEKEKSLKSILSEKFLRKQNLDQKSSLSRKKQGSRFDQKQAHTQAAPQILHLIFGPAYGKLQISRKFSAKDAFNLQR